MKCMFCEQKNFYVMKILCDHFICISCINRHKNCKLCNKGVFGKKNICEEERLPIYATMYDYDNGKI